MRPIYIFGEDETSYRFHEDHPFNPLRLELTTSLLIAAGKLFKSECVSPPLASVEELALVHDLDYIEAVQAAASGELSILKANKFGLGTEDTPIFPTIHEGAARLVGGTIHALDLVASGKAERAFHVGGGLHHGMRRKASGFCVYNDAAVAIAHVRKQYGSRVLYVDTDAHHGDGVQWLFYDDDDVMTLSIHETGRYLFPGTGMVTERGNGKGYGYSWNVPVDAFTQDDSFLTCYETVLREACEWFKPDIILTQNGADAHAFDPLTHLASTIRTFEQIPQIASRLADEYTDGRLVALGGGGYDWYRAVPRAWAQVWAGLTREAPYSGDIPREWIEKWSGIAGQPLPTRWDDSLYSFDHIPRRQQIEEKNWEVTKRAFWPFISNDRKSIYL